MKKTVLIPSIVILVLTSCERNSFISDAGFFKMDNGLEYRYSDFELYDSSTHIYYFRNDRPDFRTTKVTTFSLVAYGEEVCKGVFYPPYSSSLPYGAYIDSFSSLLQGYAFRLDFMFIDGKPVDTRNDPLIIEALREHGLLHSGLSLVINSVEMTGNRLTFKFTLANKDETDLLIIDPDKTGLNLFHYFTNGLYLRDNSNNFIFSKGISSQAPDPWNSWDIAWLSVLKSGESRQFTFNYPLSSPLAPGEYKAIFSYPGIEYQKISRDQLWQGTSRVWLGDVQVTAQVVLQ